MQVPVYGSNAYKYEREYYEKPVRKVVRKVRVSGKRQNLNAIKSMILVGAAILLAFLLLFSNSQIIEQNAKIKQLEGKLESINAQVVAGQFEIERNMDLNKIEQEATLRLGMQRPTKAQTVYVNLGNCDYAEAQGKAEGKNVFSAIADNVLEYFG